MYTTWFWFPLCATRARLHVCQLKAHSINWYSLLCQCLELNLSKQHLVFETFLLSEHQKKGSLIDGCRMWRETKTYPIFSLTCVWQTYQANFLPLLMLLTFLVFFMLLGTYIGPIIFFSLKHSLLWMSSVQRAQTGSDFLCLWGELQLPSPCNGVFVHCTTTT